MGDLISSMVMFGGESLGIRSMSIHVVTAIWRPLMSQVHLKLPLRVDVSFFQSQVSLCKKWYPEEKTRPAKKVVCTRFPGLTRNPPLPFFLSRAPLTEYLRPIRIEARVTGWPAEPGACSSNRHVIQVNNGRTSPETCRDLCTGRWTTANPLRCCSTGRRHSR